MFEFGFKLKWEELSDELKGHEKKVFELYEYWCYFKLIEIMESICDMKVDFEDIFAFTDDGMSLKLDEGIGKAFIYNGYTVKLLYNKTFKRSNDDYKSYSVKLRPDYSLEVQTNDKKYYIHFDAKYKAHVDSETFKNEDIVKMHAYKDAISNTIGAYVLYPGSNNEIYYENEFESVGAFGLIPGEERIDKIAELICKLLENIGNI